MSDGIFFISSLMAKCTNKGEQNMTRKEKIKELTIATVTITITIIIGLIIYT